MTEPSAEPSTDQSAEPSTDQSAEPSTDQSSGQPELDLGLVPTGDPRVDAALAALDTLAERPVDEHPEVFESVHRGLQEALADVPDPSGPDPSGPDPSGPDPSGPDPSGPDPSG